MDQSSVSMRRDRSKVKPPEFRHKEPRTPSPTSSSVSMESDDSKGIPPDFRRGQPRTPSPTSSSVSMESDDSKGIPPDFRRGQPRTPSPTSSSVSMESDDSKGIPPDFRRGQPRPSQSWAPVSGPRNSSEDATDSPSQGDSLMHRVKEDWKKIILAKYETELSGKEVNSKLFEKVKKTTGYTKKPVQSYSEIFMKSDTEKVRTVRTKGEAKSGKTFHTRKFMVEWATGSSNKSIDFIVPLNFSELNARRDQTESMEDLLSHLLNDVNHSGINFCECNLAFILDGLENCRLPLDFKKTQTLTDVKEPASTDTLLTNLIKGNLLPKAHLWITSQPSGVKKISDRYINKVTGCEVSLETTKKRLITEVKKRVQDKFEGEIHKLEMDSELYEMSDNEVVKEYNIFTNSRKEGVRTVLTEGVAGIGKTFQTRRMMVDWAKGLSNQDIDFIIPLTWSELKKRGKEEQSMEDVLSPFLYGVKQEGKKVCISDCKLVIILDGFEACKSTLDFERNRDDIDDISKPAPMDVLLTNLIKSTLLPAARLWIISRPSGADKIPPPQHIDKVTGCRETSKRREQLVSNLKKRFSEEYDQVEDPYHENQKNTEHISRDHRAEETSEEGQTHGKATAKTVTPVNVLNIFKQEKDEKVRTVLTVGEAGVGKTFHVQKVVKEWVKNQHQSVLSRVVTWGSSFFGQTNDNVEVLFPINLSKYEFTMEKEMSLVELLNSLFEETKKSVISDYSKFRLTFILDGLDAFQPPLEFDNPDNKLNDARKPAPVSVLLTNLIRGDLLSEAKVWITSQSSAAEKLPVEWINRKTEIREKPDITSKKRLKGQIRKQLTYVSQGTDRDTTSALLNEIYTDLYIIEGERGEDEGKLILDARSAKDEKAIRYSDIFKNTLESTSVPIKTVLTTGVAGIGKTFASMKYMLDWAETPLGEDVDYTFPLPFRELNLQKEHKHSLEELIHQFFPAMETSEITNYDKYKILIVLDGYDECRFDLNFDEGTPWTDVKKQTSVGVLLTNLIQGNLLPNAQIWITSRPAASNNIPAKKISRVTEVRGFNDKQKEEYFRKRFSDKELAEQILSDVKSSRSLFIMCYIPVFCWITSKVMEDIVKQQPRAAMPKTLTDMYTYFLSLQCDQANVKYNEEETSESSEADSRWNDRNKETVLSLGKLAFEELEKGNLIFTKELLKERGINVKNAAVFSGLFTQIKREGPGFNQQELFCFVHLSIQEFLAAFHVTHTFTNFDKDVFTEASDSESPPSDFYMKAVDKALESKHGDLDMFIRFLLGLSLETNQDLLKELLKTTEKEKNTKNTYQETVEHVKKKIKDVTDPDKVLNLFHCLNELNDNSLVKEVNISLQSERNNFESYSRSQWSALTFVLLTSDTNLDVFDLKKYLKSEKVLLGLLPVVKVSETTLLSWCDLTEASCSGLTSSVLSSPSSNLTVLDLSHNDLLDAGVEQLAEGLKSIYCKLKTLKLAGCQVTARGCSALAAALKENEASPLKELDLSYNHPGGRGLEKLRARFADPSMKLRADYPGEHRLKPGLKKYDPLLKFDEKTAGQRLILSAGNRKVQTVRSVKEKESRPEDEERFKRSQVLCEEGLQGLGYWELEWKGKVGVAVTYSKVGRTWDSRGGLGSNDNSWSLLCSTTGFVGKDGKMFTGFIARHGKTSVHIHAPCHQKLAVFLDWEKGTLSYYGVLPGELSLIHTFQVEFTHPVFPGFWFQRGSVTLCDNVSDSEANGLQ